MSTELQTTAPPREAKLSQWVQRAEVQEQIAAAVGDIMDPKQFISHALVAFQQPHVINCTPASKLQALYEMAALGLLATLQQVALIPYKSQIKAMPQWQGYKAVMERHPAILEVEPHLVHTRDEFTFSDGEVRHSFSPFDRQRAFRGIGDIQGGYCRIVYRDGRPPKFHFVSAEHIDKCRKCAQTQDVWNRWFEQMARKTVLRDCYARRAVPVDPLVAARMERLLRADDVVLGNSPMRIAPVASGVKRLASALDEAEQPDAPPAAEEPEETHEPSTDPHEDAAQAAAAEVEAGPNGTEPSEADIALNYEAAINECTGIREVNAVAEKANNDTRLSPTARTALDRIAQDRRAMIRATRGGKRGE